ncbi:HD-GYP domain-containing protein [Mobilicoccus massiliensis]|uniref:HD-GYP domain-containing protein n=1 Tax=Mobilicoccus massiliensis TaxID=1522310 RepID=UPI0011422341|nr:HD domain-containing phosphohydrolase [Mobilicoccus massiliensis]
MVVTAGLTIAVTALAYPQRATTLGDAFSFTVLLVAAAASAELRFGRREERVSFSFTAVVLLAAIPLVGPLGAVLLGFGGAVLDSRQDWWLVSVFNGLMFALSSAVASLVYGASGGAFLFSGDLLVDGRLVVAAPTLASALTRHVGGPLLLADAAFLATNLVVLLAITARDTQGPGRRVVAGGVLRGVPMFLAWAVVAFLVVALWGPGRLDAIALLLVVAPLIVTRHMHGLFSAERRVRFSIVDALADAGADDGRKAHGERVGRYALSIASELGLRPTDRSGLEYAARLHTVGVHDGCTAEVRVGAREASTTAARAADEVLGRIEFLTQAAQAVRHESEWFDGTGGPDALAGGDIPVQARILAVADAADVLVNESDADVPGIEVLRVLRERAGTQFDPHVVDALARALRFDAFGEVEASSAQAVDPPREAFTPARLRGRTGRRAPGHAASANPASGADR